MTKVTEVPKGYKKTKVGVIPEDWEVKRLNNLCKIVRGSSPRPAGDPQFFDGNYIPWLTVKSLTSISDSQISVLKTATKLTEEGAKRSRVLQKGTLILSNSGATLGVPKILGITCCANDGVAAFLDVKSASAEVLYLYYYLTSKTKYFQEVVAPGNGQPNLNTELIGEIYLQLPRLKEQKKIASILSTWDEAIAKTQQTFDALKERNDSLAMQLLSGKKRLEEFEGKWETVRMKDAFEEVREVNDGGKHEPLTISAKLGFVSQKDKFDKVIAGSSLAKYTLIKAGDFCYNKGNSKTYPMGCIFKLEKFSSALVPFVYISFRAKTSIESDFFKYWFSHHGLDRQLKAIITSGARGDGLLNVNRADFFNLKLPKPPLEEQKAIAQVLQQADQELQHYQNKLDTLREQKKGLMQKLLKGEVRVQV